jgi:hypothetical protein
MGCAEFDVPAQKAWHHLRPSAARISMVIDDISDLLWFVIHAQKRNTKRERCQRNRRKKFDVFVISNKWYIPK